jgi:hypothetical protein
MTSRMFLVKSTGCGSSTFGRPAARAVHGQIPPLPCRPSLERWLCSRFSALRMRACRMSARCSIPCFRPLRACSGTIPAAGWYDCLIILLILSLCLLLCPTFFLVLSVLIVSLFRVFFLRFFYIIHFFFVFIFLMLTSFALCLALRPTTPTAVRGLALPARQAAAPSPH